MTKLSFLSKGTLMVAGTFVLFVSVDNLLTSFGSTSTWRASATLTTSDSALDLPQRPNGVFIMKVEKPQQACRTLCTLTRFFNNHTKYPIRIFSQQNYTESTLAEVLSYAGHNVDLKIIVDSEGWKQLPPELTQQEREVVLSKCIDTETPETTKCSEMKAPLGYLYMGYWRYMRMQHEPSLQEFEYFVSVDVDGYFTYPMRDPFIMMHENNLTGFFNAPSHQSGCMGNGVQEAVEAVFSIEERQNKYLDTPHNQYFDSAGLWRDRHGLRPSIRGSFFGGRLDFFRTAKFHEFARRMVPHTYISRTDEQAVIGVAWSLMAGSSVWVASQRGIQMGWFHQMWVDNHQVVRKEAVKPPPGYNTTKNSTSYWLNTLVDHGVFRWISQSDLMMYEDYVRTLGYEKGDGWERCICAKTKVNYVLRLACPEYKLYD